MRYVAVRRRALGPLLVGAMIALTGWTSAWPATGAGASPPPSAGPAAVASGGPPELAALRSRIRHVVVMIQENHTFDNVLGHGCATTSRCRGVAIGRTVRLGNGAMVRIKQAADHIPETDHSYEAQQRAWNGGRNDGWHTLSGCEPPRFRCMEAFTPAQVPALWSLARNFSLSDNTVTCNPVSSWGDHFTWQTACNLNGFKGTIPVKKTATAGPTWGCRSGRVEPWSPTGAAPWRLVPSCNPDYSSGLPNGGAFEPTPVRSIRTLGQNCDLAASCTRASYNTSLIWSTDEPHAYLAFHRNVRRSTSQFLTDARTGNLPGLSILTPSMPAGNTSQHNSASMAVGDRGIAAAAQAVMNGPDWNSTAMFITYDDCGCFYDHVAPNRVPMVIVSPWAKRGGVDSTRTSFAGTQAFIENVFGLPRLNNADRNAYAYQNAFNFNQATLPAVQLPQAPIPASSRELAKPGYLADDDDVS